MQTSALDETARYLFHQGTNTHTYEMLGAHPEIHGSEQGVRFATWEKDADAVSVVGDFNEWDISRNPMTQTEDGDLWWTFIPCAQKGEFYKYAVRHGDHVVLKSDPYGFAKETGGEMASRIANLDEMPWRDRDWLEKRRRTLSYGRPMLIYRVDILHLKNQSATLDTPAKIIAHALEMGSTHLEFAPVMDGFAPSDFAPEEICSFVDSAHQKNLGVVFDLHVEGLDWGQTETASYLTSQALFMFREYHADGLKLIIPAMTGDFGDDFTGGNRDLAEILKGLNIAVFGEYPQCLMVCEELAEFRLTRPVYLGGMGFNYKWNMRWQRDAIYYMTLAAEFRPWNHDKLTFTFMDAFTENFILPIPAPDFLYANVPGSKTERLQALRCFYACAMAHPGKKLFYAQGESEAANPIMAGFIMALGSFYTKCRPLWEVDFDWNGFQWINDGDSENSIIAFLRKGEDPRDFLLVVSNFSKQTNRSYRIGVPEKGAYLEVFSSNAEDFGGSGLGNTGELHSQNIPWQGRKDSILLVVPAMTTIYLRKL